MAEAQAERLILCFDGTWNTPEDQTNVSRIYAAIADQHAGCESQLKFYDAGVGTAAGSRLVGGATGAGLDDNILQGFSWLINEYDRLDGDGEAPHASDRDGRRFEPGPDIFIFGFSRGAYTARSLAGMINRCGIPKLEALPQKSRADVNSEVVRRAWELYRTKMKEGRNSAECVEFRKRHCWNPKVKFLGVWDTVGALGVPWFSRTPLAILRYGFHDTSLGRVIEHAYHAVAIDEHREDYQVTLWDAKHPVGTKRVEQRWFPGAHSNVGGGYEDDLLPDPPLRWMAERAIEQGLEFTSQFQAQLGQLTCRATLPDDFKLRGDEYQSPVRDSYGEFLHGVYAGLRRLRRKGAYYRPMLVDGVNETIDATAHMKWSADPSYRPSNLAYAGRRDVLPAGKLVPVAPVAQQSEAGTA